MPLTYEQACRLLRDTMQKYCIDREDEDEDEDCDYASRFGGNMDDAYFGGYEDGHNDGRDEVARVVHAILDSLG